MPEIVPNEIAIANTMRIFLLPSLMSEISRTIAPKVIAMRGPYRRIVNMSLSAFPRERHRRTIIGDTSILATKLIKLLSSSPMAAIQDAKMT